MALYTLSDRAVKNLGKMSQKDAVDKPRDLE